ncbi:DUF305 domain-containing protein [Microbacterium testaceum]|uniref:DUF305 domain-containing protein n=1 Tax=Microbacterium testaceum TaxID=2033 RepID=UPI000734EC6E|nr:DUF305 domain-containing protein [Microbacterium testaceum]KTS04795.1 hypothetical protein NS283_08350 [Microbacterium testaceum]
MKNPFAATAALTLTTVLLLAGCSGAAPSHDDMPGMDHGGSAAPPATTDANDADVMFASMMIPHHAQAIEMSDTLLSKDGIDERVTALAETITAAQQPEIDKMTGWLDDWGIDSPDTDAMHHGDGMMSDDDMRALENASGDEAAQLFLSQMIQHHRGAVDMAQEEIEDGSNPDAVALAKSIVEAQMAEIAEMEQLQAKL